jgi:hypothetical protein
MGGVSGSEEREGEHVYTTGLNIGLFKIPTPVMLTTSLCRASFHRCDFSVELKRLAFYRKADLFAIWKVD